VLTVSLYIQVTGIMVMMMMMMMMMMTLIVRFADVICIYVDTSFLDDGQSTSVTPYNGGSGQSLSVTSLLMLFIFSMLLIGR